MRLPTDDYVPLKRTFLELTDDSVANDGSDPFQLRGTRKKIGWSDLLDEHRVILLSEAGTGKTTEILQIARGLRDEGKNAFFVRIEYIADSMDIAFDEISSHADFLAWAASGQEGWLFLDSIDEARLRHPRDFERAIRIIGQKLRPVLQQAHIVITGRTTAWKVKTDLLLCQASFPYSPPTSQAGECEGQNPTEASSVSKPLETNSSGFRFVAIEDLHDEQITQFVRAKGIKDPQAFLDKIDQMDAWFLTARPQDLNELIKFWEKHRRIGTRYELMINSVERRLTEHHQDRLSVNPIAPATLRDGARLVAAAATLCHESAIQTPDGAYNDQGLAVGKVLTDWSDPECQLLLERPIFDERIYGTVRFHHRSVREYLTAEWLNALLINDGSRRQIEGLFFRNQYGIEVIVPVMRPVLAWLAILDAPILERLCRIAPEVVFEGGDPSRLPLATRSKILRQACEQLAQPAQGRSLIDIDSAKRFAAPDLADDINALLVQYSDDEDITWFLLVMIWHGQIVGAIDETKRFALSASSKYSRIAAFRALKAIGSEQDRLDVRVAILLETGELDRDWVAELVLWLPPDEGAVTWLVEALKRVAPPKQFSVDSLSHAVARHSSEWPVGLLNRIVIEFSELMEMPPLKEVYPSTLSERFNWLTTPAASIMLAIIGKRELGAIDSAALSLLRKIPILQDAGELDAKDVITELHTQIAGWPELNQKLFWYGVERSREFMCARGYLQQGLTLFHQVDVSGHLWSYSEADFEAVCKEITSREMADDRKVALSLAFSLYRSSDSPSALLEMITSSCGNDEHLRAMLDHLINPPTGDNDVWIAQHASWQRKSARRKAVLEGRRRQWTEGLQKEVHLLRSPPEPGQLNNRQLYLLERLQEVSKHSGNWSDRTWEDLIPEVGEAVASAFRDGAIKHWRVYTPQLRSEGAALNSTLYSVILGLVGLSFEARINAEWFVGLSPAQASLATRYALHELNGFPGWLPGLYNAHREAVLDTLMGEIQFELSSKNPKENSHYVLNDISSGGDWIWDGLATRLIYELKSSPKDVTRLRNILNILQGSTLSDCVLVGLAAKKAKSAKGIEIASIWFALWVGVAPEEAIPSLAARLGSIEQEESRTRFAMLFITALMGSRRQRRAVRDAFRTVEHMKALYLLMNTYIHEQDDIDRANSGVYSPELRDDAQDARNALLSFIRETPGKEAFLTLMEISQSHPNAKSRPWLALQAKAKATLEADMAPWLPQQVRDFHDRQERTPADHRGLWDLAVSQLQDLKHDLEHGDSSIASLLQPMNQETEIRKFIGGWCRKWARGRYVIPQEEEFADAKRADLRFHGAGFDAQVPVELKLADKWSGPRLEERLQNQLCGDYMRDARSRYGIFLLVYHGTKPGRSWMMSDGTTALTFEALVIKLQSRWSDLATSYPHIEDILVIGINLTTRGAPVKPSSKQ